MHTPLSAFNTLYDIFLKCSSLQGHPIYRYYNVGGHDVRLQFSGTNLLPFVSPAINHLTKENCLTPSLTICLWDSTDGGAKTPSPPWESDIYLSNGEVLGYNDERIQTVYRTNYGILEMLDHSRNIALYWVRDVNKIPAYELGSPMRTILNWWMNRYDNHIAHGACVGSAKGGVVIAGRGGAGKSTTAMSCLSAGWYYLGDDSILLSTKSRPTAYSLYSSAKLESLQMGKMQHMLADNLKRITGKKEILFLNDHYGPQIKDAMPICAILLPTISHQSQTRLEKASPGESLRALVPYALRQSSAHKKNAFKTMANFIRQVPAFRLILGTDLQGIPEVIEEVILKEI